MTQAPTPGPLGSESVKLLVKGDYIRGPNGKIYRLQEWGDGGFLIFIDEPHDGYLVTLCAFIGRPDADGWVKCRFASVPDYLRGIQVEAKTYNDLIRPAQKAENVAWSNMIAFRLAPTAPVEASGSEREHGPKCWGKTSISDEMMYCYCGSTDSPPGETREAVARIIRDERGENPSPLKKTDAILALALGGQHSGGEWRCEDCGAQADEWFDCCKNPARAEAQDEGAAGSFEERAIMLTKKHGNPVGTDYEQGQNDMGYRMVTMARDADAALAAARAHPSPTPAADADRVRGALVWIAEQASGVDPHKAAGMLQQIEAEALAALTSEGK